MRLSKKLRWVNLWLTGIKPPETIRDRFEVFDWPYPEILVDLEELGPEGYGPSEQAKEVLELDCSSQVGRYCHVIIDCVESIRPGYRPSIFDVELRDNRIDPNGDDRCNAIHLMFIALFG